jgi:hypothetical protein
MNAVETAVYQSIIGVCEALERTGLYLASGPALAETLARNVALSGRLRVVETSVRVVEHGDELESEGS